MKLVIVGGGVVGTMHALFAVHRGHEVVHLERDAEPRKASVRNFGLIWVSGRAAGAELALALRARGLWEAISREVPGIGFRADGSITLASHPAELAVMEELAAQPDAGERQLDMLDPDGVRAANPALRGRFLGGLLCRLDAVVEPGRVLPALRSLLTGEAGERYRWLPGHTAVETGTGAVVDQRSGRHEADIVLVCPGADLAGSGLDDGSLRKCRLQMLQTAPYHERLTTAVADGDSLRYYPAFRLPSSAALPEPDPDVAGLGLQLLVAQRAGGELTIGDTHAYDEPFDFAVDEGPYTKLIAKAEELIGARLPPVVRRWSGVYSVCTDDQILDRRMLADGVFAVTGLAGRGMTLSPAVAEATLDQLGL